MCVCVCARETAFNSFLKSRPLWPIELSARCSTVQRDKTSSIIRQSGRRHVIAVRVKGSFIIRSVFPVVSARGHLSRRDKAIILAVPVPTILNGFFLHCSSHTLGTTRISLCPSAIASLLALCPCARSPITRPVFVPVPEDITET